MNSQAMAIAVVIAALSGGVFADDRMTNEEPNRPEATFKALDADKDGYIEPQEARSNVQLNQNFKEVDTNGDNKISEREFVAATSGGTPRPDMMDRVPGSGTDRGTYR